MNFVVETSDVADAEIESAFLNISARDPEFAGRWAEGLYRLIGTLNIFPGMYPRVDESDVVGREVRRAFYRNRQTVYRILFTLLDADGDGDLDTVRVLHVRHGAQRPLGQVDTEDER